MERTVRTLLSRLPLLLIVVETVVGSIVGNPEQDVAAFRQFSGIAAQSRIAFFDLGINDGGSESLSVPGDLGEQLLHWAFVSGARIHSDSWGSDTAEYTSDSQDMDEYMWQHKDFLVLVAAGNSGEYTMLHPDGHQALASLTPSIPDVPNRKRSDRRRLPRTSLPSVQA
jgi:hypothetical protein